MHPQLAHELQRSDTLEAILALVRDDMERAERLLKEQSRGPVPLMPKVAEHLVGAGGKRLRPLLCCLAARLADIPRDLAIRVAVAGELIHTASLLHDDVVDGTPLRRGNPSAPRIFGNSACVLMGDAMLARSIALLSDLEEHAPLRGLSRCVRRMAVGELLQLAQVGKPSSSLLSYLRIIEGKTSALFAWCCTSGDLCREPLRAQLARFGRCLGMAFQIADDILDYTGDPTRMGKAAGTDLREGKITLPLHYACQRRPQIRRVVEDVFADPADPERLDRLVDAVRQSGGVERARADAETLLARAHRALDPIAPSIWRESLHKLADTVVARAS